MMDILSIDQGLNTIKMGLLEQVFSSLPAEVMIVDKESRIFFMNDHALNSCGLKNKDIKWKKVEDVNLGSYWQQCLRPDDQNIVIKTAEDKRGIITQMNIFDRNNNYLGVIQAGWSSEVVEKLIEKLDSYSSLAKDLKAVFESSYDVIYVSDVNGVTLRVSSACERLWGYKEEELIGRSVYELEKCGVYKPSITRLVLEKKEKVQGIQTTKTGRRLMVVGTPIKDENGKVVRVINTSRDITQESLLQNELESTKTLMEGYKRELDQLKQLRMQDDQLIFKSEEMRKVVSLAYRVAEVDSTVLILGESGVGKEVIASYVHHNSPRKDKPFIKVNCGAIPENLLESELFGYEKGAFTGASKEGKLGLFELANEGTLFLDEIGEMPLPLQVKLLRVLQENEFVRLGGSRPVKTNVRIISATNRNLEADMKKGLFREDLYYRLNVIPFYIPPLRARREDIIPLAVHFVEGFNRKYSREKQLSHETLEYIQNYSWPGNVRELRNIIERLIVISENNLIQPNHLPDIMTTANEPGPGVKATEIMPLKEAVEMLERQLIVMAKDKYGTTTNIAKALGVDQSTISRKMKRMKLE